MQFNLLRSFSGYLTITLIGMVILLIFIPNFQIYALSAKQSGYQHGCSDANISDPDNRYINQPKKGPAFHTGSFMDGYHNGFNECNPKNHNYDCTIGSAGCDGLIYCDLDTHGMHQTCYDRFD